MNLRRIVDSFAHEAHEALGQSPGVFEVHLHPDNQNEIGGFHGPSSLSEFLKDWGTEFYMGTGYTVPSSAWSERFIGVIHDCGVVLVRLGASA